MAKIPLRAYLQEIESAIYEGQTDEAVAHCRHILQSFPKHVDTYRLLGKAFLEARQYPSAADIFERVLSAVPDDFIAHLGMSIIREDDGSLDAAIWHMERAFEVQPYNPAIQEELRRLYGKRDGMTPPKVRLTPAALARTYAKGGHYPQAIAELRSTLAQDPDRPDLLVLLAEMYARNGDDVHAIETCSQILKKLPYCLQANRLLAQLLEGTQRQEDRKICLQRLHELDPYEAHTSQHAPIAAEVPDQAVVIERLRWDGRPVSPAGDLPPDWASSLGVDLGEQDSAEEALPEWLSASTEEGTAASTEETGGEAIPEWMRDAGWEPATGEASEEPIDLGVDEPSEESAEEAVPADLPDWIKDIAPAAALGEASSDDEDASDIEGEDLAALEELFEAATASPAESTPAAEDTSEGLPEWLTGEEHAAPEPELDLNLDENAVPEWLEGIEETQEEPEPTPRLDETPEWLEEITEEEPVPERGLTDFLKELEEEPTATEATPTTEEEVPDWLSEIEEEAPAAEPTPTAEEEIPDWLSEIEEETPAAEPTPTTEEEVPDWLSEIEVEAPAAEATPTSEDLPDFLKNLEESPSEPAATAEGDIPDWLSGIEEEAPPAEPAPADEDALPDFLKTLDEVPAEPAPAAEGETPDWLSNLEEAAPSAEPTTPVSKEPTLESDIPDWLNELVEETPAPETESAETGAADIPDWLDELSAAEEAPAAAQPPAEAEPTSEPDFPEWLAQPRQESEEEIPAAEEEPEFPEWLEAPADEPEAEPATSETPAAEAAAEPPVDLSDPDAAMAWLESLAAKRGVPEEELITRPEDRPATAPDWVPVQETPAEEEQAEEEPIEEPVAAAPPISEEPVAETPPPEPTPAAQPAEEETADDLPEWLREGAFAVPPPTSEETATPAVSPAEEAEAAPEPSTEEAAPPTEEPLPDWLREAETGPAPEAAAETPAEEEAIPEWLQDAAEESSPVDATWIREFGKDIPSREEIAAATTQPESTSPAETAADSPPAEKLDLNRASLVELERLPGMGFRRAQLVFSYREAHGPYQSFADLQSIPGLEAEAIEALKQYTEITAPPVEEPAAPPPPTPEAPATPPVQPEDEHHARQLQARQQLEAGAVDAALETYVQLIKKGKRLDEVVADLEYAAQRYPTNADVLQTLGDAYMRQDRLQEALDTYSRAERLVQMQ